MGFWDNFLKTVGQANSAAPQVTEAQQNVVTQEQAKPAAERAGQHADTSVRALRGATNPAAGLTPAGRAGRTPAQTALSPSQPTQSPVQRAALTPTILPGGSVVTPASTPAQRARNFAPASLQPETVKPSKPKASEVAASMSGKGLRDLYNGTTSVTGYRPGKPSVPYTSSEGTLFRVASELDDMYNNTVKPAWDAYKEAEQAYQNGTGSYQDLLTKRDQYVNIYNVYQPQQEAWANMSSSENRSYWDLTDPDDLPAAIDMYNTAFAEGQARIDEMQKNLEARTSEYEALQQSLESSYQQLQEAEAALRAGKITSDQYFKIWNEFERKRSSVVEAGNELSKLEGQYNAAALYLAQIADTGNYGLEVYRTRYLKAHPEILYLKGQGLEFDLSGNTVRNDFTFQGAVNRIDELREERKTADERRQKKIDEEIKAYNWALQAGYQFANLSIDDLPEQTQFFQDRLDAAQAELEDLSYIEQFKRFEMWGGDPPVVPEGRDYYADLERYNELQSVQADASDWLQKIKNRKYELTYESLLETLPKDVQEKINTYIQTGGYYEDQTNGGFWIHNQINGPQVVNGNVVQATTPGTDEALTAEAEIRSMLEKEGFDNKQIADILYYATLQANEARTNSFINETAGEARSTYALADWIFQRMLAPAKWSGAVSATGQTLFGGPDSFTGEAAPVDYYNDANLAAHAFRAVGQGAAARTIDWLSKVYGADSDDERVQLEAKILNGAFNLTGSMADSTITKFLSLAGGDIGLLIMSSGAATDAMIEMHEKGYSDEAVFTSGVVAGIAEFWSEHANIDELMGIISNAGTKGVTFSDVMRFLRHDAVRQGLSEGAEEVFSDIVNTVYDETAGKLFNGGLTQIRYDALQKQREDPGLSWDDAVVQSWKEWVLQSGEDFLGGFLSGYGMAGIGAAGGYVFNNQATHLGESVQGNGVHGDNTYKLIQATRNLPSQKAAEAAGLTGDLGRGGANHVGRTLSRYMDYRILEAAEVRLKELGVSDERITPDLLHAIDAAAGGSPLSPTEKSALRKSAEGQQVMRELQAYRDELRSAEEEGRAIDIENQEEWAINAETAKELTRMQYTMSDIGANETAQRVNELELQYQAAQAENPDATVMTPMSKKIESNGASPEVAVKQGKLLDKVFSGSNLTNKEMRALDLNNKAVRDAFIERTGMTGIPDGGVSDGLKRIYVNQASRESRLIQERQAALKEGASQLDELNKQKSAERTEALKAEAEKNRNPIRRILDNLTGRKQRRINAANRQADARAMAVADALNRFSDGMAERDVVDLIRRQYGVMVDARSIFEAAAARDLGKASYDQLSATEQAAIAEQYDQYLGSLGLPEPAVRALDNAVRGTAQVANVGEVVFDGSVDQEKLRQDAFRQSQVTILTKLAKALGLKIYLYESQNVQGMWSAVTDAAVITTDNGWFDRRDGSIHLDINAGENGQGVILFTAAHELTHLIKAGSPERFEVLKKFLFDRYRGYYSKIVGKSSDVVEDLINAQIRKIRNQGRAGDYTPEQLHALAEEEVVADSFEIMLAGEDAAKALIELSDVDAELGDEIIGSLRNLYETIRETYKDLDPDSTEAKMAGAMEGAFDELRGLWIEGLSDAAQRYQEMAPKDIDGDPGDPQLSSMRSYAQGAGFELIFDENGKPVILDKNGKRVKEVTADMVVDSPLGKLVQDAVRLQGADKIDAQKQYQFIADLTNMIIEYRDASIVWETAGSLMFSAIKANSDKQYNTTIDFSTICKKTQQMLNVMSETMKKLGHGLNRKEVEAAYEEIHKSGEQVPCPVCYVFSHWMGIGSILDDINRFQNKYWTMDESDLTDLMASAEQAAIRFAKETVEQNPGKKDTYIWEKDGIQDGVKHKAGDVKIGRAISDLKGKLGRSDMLKLQNQLNASVDTLLRIQELENPRLTTEMSEKDAEMIARGNAEQVERLWNKLLGDLLTKAEQKAPGDRLAKINAKLDELEKQIDELKNKLEPFEAYQFLNGTIMLQDADGNWHKNENYNNGNGPIPPEILFDLNAGNEFAAQYPDTWRYRTTRGNNAGKAMLPYSDARVGEVIQGIGMGINKIENLDPTLNPFLFADTPAEQKARLKQLKQAIDKQRLQNLIGGMRYQSTSDFRHQFGSDYLMTFFEMQAIGANVQLYTKVIEAVDFLASMGADCNLSVMPLNNGYVEDENGNRRLVFSSVTGMNGEAAIQMAHKYDNVQPILVGINDAHIRLALHGKDITFVIPFHGSGNTTEQIQTLMSAVQEVLDIGAEGKELTYDEGRARDYTKTQSDNWLDAEKLTQDQKDLRAIRLAIIKGTIIPTTQKVKGKNVALEYFTFEDAWNQLTPEQQNLLNQNEILKNLFERFYVKGVDSVAYRCFLAGEQAKTIFPYEYWDQNSTYTMRGLSDADKARFEKYMDPSVEYDEADRNGFLFQENCEALGVVPRFSGVTLSTGVTFGRFTQDTGYWKLLIDRPMFANRYDAKGNWVGYGKYRPQQVINVNNFKAETIDPQWASSNYGDVMVPDTDVSKTAGITDRVVARIQRGEALRNGDEATRRSSRGYDYSKSFGEQIDDYIAGVHPKDDTLVVGETPQALRDVGFAALPMTYATGHLRDVIDIRKNLDSQIADPMSSVVLSDDDWDHSFGVSVLKDLPRALEHPFAVIRSEREPDSSVVVFTEFSYAGKPMIAAFKINGVGKDNGDRFDSYAITSFYRARVATKMLNNAIDEELKGQVAGVYYLDKEKAAGVADPSKLTQLGDSGSSDGLYHKITDSKAEVNPKIRDNTNTLQFKRWFAGSKLANQDGTPMVMYHQTGADNAQRTGVGYVVTTEAGDGAREVYARLRKPFKVNAAAGAMDGKSLAKQIIQSGSLRNFANRAAMQGRIGMVAAMADEADANDALASYLRGLGYDGIQFNDGTALLFNENQIKATDNIGLYSQNSDNLRYSGRATTDFFPANSYTEDPGYQAALTRSRELWQQRNENRARRNEIDAELRSESTPKPRAEWTDADELDSLLGRQPVVLTERGKQLTEERKKLWSEYSKIEEAESKVDAELLRMKMAAHNAQIREYTPIRFQPAQQASYPGFTLEESGNPYATDILERGLGVVVEMSPREYLECCAYEIFDGATLESTIYGIDFANAQEYAQNMLDGDQFPLPYLDYKTHNQEGRHRAMAAYLAGIDQIPVLIIGNYQRTQARDSGDLLHSTRATVAPVQQNITSAATSINANKIPVLYTNNNVKFIPDGVNVDIGGGRFDNVTELLGGMGVTNLIFDPYNRSEEHNSTVLAFLTSGQRADTVTCSNCLNVIAEPEARSNVILECAKALKPDGAAYFTVYEGDGTGESRATKSGWQENRKTATYADEVREYFDNVQVKGKVIIAQEAKADLPQATWETTPGTAYRYSSRNVQNAQDAVSELDKRYGKGTSKNLEALVRKYQQRAENAQKQLELERAQRKLQERQFKKDLLEAKRITGQIQNASSKALRVTNNELNRAKRENQRRVAALEKKMADLAVDTEWRVGLAKSDGEQKLKAQKRFFQDKLNYNAKTDRQWARGIANSRESNARKEERRVAKSKLDLQRKVLSLPGSAAVKARRKFNSHASKVAMINDKSSVYTPLNFGNEADSKLPKTATEFREKMTDLYGKFYRAMVNDVAELDNMAKLQTRTDSLSVMINVLRASSATPEMFYHTGMVDKNGNIVGPSFEELLLCHDANGKFDPQMQAALQDYMYHKHNVDRMSLEKRAIERVQEFVNNGRQWLLDLTNTELAQLAAEGNRTVREYVQLMQWANSVKNKAVMADADNYAVTAESSQAVCDTYEREMPWLKEKAEEIYKYWDIFMREWAVGTSISATDYEEMRQLYPHYVPTYRVQPGQKARVTNTSNGIVTGEMIKGAKGSTKELLSLEDQFVKSMQNIVQGARLNDVSRNLIEELLFDDEGVFSDFGVYDWDNASEAFKQTFWDFDDEQSQQRIEKITMDGKEVYRISCWVDGVKMSAYVNRAMFEGMQSLAGRNNEIGNAIAKVGRKVTAPMKGMITGYNPFFAAKNIIRDQHTAMTNSMAGAAYWKYLGRAAALMNQNADEWVNFQALGGVSSNETRMDGGFAKAMQPGSGVKQAANWTKEKLGTLGDLSESVSRFAEYLAVVDMLGGDTYENRLAAIRAAAEVTVDFGRGGSWGRVINAWVPYWNANVQGLDKMTRNIAEQPDFVSMAKRLGRAGLVNVIPAALQAAIIHALGRWKDYEELSDQQKDNYYCIPVPGKEHKFVKLPKSQDWAAFISTPFIRAMEGVNGRDDPWEGWFESAVMPNMPFDTRTVLGVKNVPVLLPIGLDWALELAENKNYAGSAIIPYNLQDVSAKEQFDADTSLLAYYFGQIFKGSPMALDYIINDYMGNFWGVLAKSLPVSPLASRGMFTGETPVAEKLADMNITIASPFITDNRASNSTMAAYYDMLNELEQEVLDAGAHGDKKDAEHYKIYEALTQSGGYVDQIKAITAEAREHVKGEEQNQIRWEAVGLADLAMEFVEKCLSGEIKVPELWMTYAPYGDTILAEAESLKKYESANDGDFNFNGNLGKPKTIWDRTGDTDLKYDLSENPTAQQEYNRLRAEEYKKALETIIRSADYKSLSGTEQAARLEKAKQAGLKKADQRMLEYLRESGVKGETITKTDYSAEERAAAYSVSWLLGEQGAYKPELTDEFVSLYDYNDQYSFIPSESTKKTFKDQSDTGKVYVLNTAQQKKYAEVYHDTITKAYTTVMQSAEYKAAGAELRAAMLARAKTYANDEIKAAFDAWLKTTGATATTQEKASPEISLEAKYAVQRALGDDHAMSQTVTDELIRLYQYSDVGEVQFFPIVTAPKKYVDDQNEGQMWVLTEDQREVYMAMMFDIYQRNIKKVMDSPRYKQSTDYEQAQMLCDVRDRLSGETQAEFKYWLRQTHVPTVSRTSPEAQAVQADIERAGRIVDQILGSTFRTYKDFSEGRGYTQPKKKKRK